MDMENLAEILEEELAEAVEVKNRKSLHRYVLLLTQQHIDRQTHEQQYQELRGDIRELVRGMEHGFQRMDERFEAINQRFKDINQRFEDIYQRFEAVDKRFEAIDKRFEAVDKRFEAIDKRFEEVHSRFSAMLKLIGIGFTLLALLIAAFNAALLFTG